MIHPFAPVSEQALFAAERGMIHPFAPPCPYRRFLRLKGGRDDPSIFPVPEQTLRADNGRPDAQKPARGLTTLPAHFPNILTARLRTNAAPPFIFARMRRFRRAFRARRRRGRAMTRGLFSTCPGVHPDREAVREERRQTGSVKLQRRRDRGAGAEDPVEAGERRERGWRSMEAGIFHAGRRALPRRGEA